LYYGERNACSGGQISQIRSIVCVDIYPEISRSLEGLLVSRVGKEACPIFLLNQTTSGLFTIRDKNSNSNRLIWTLYGTVKICHRP